MNLLAYGIEEKHYNGRRDDRLFGGSGCVTRKTGGQDGDIIQDKHMGQAEGNILI